MIVLKFIELLGVEASKSNTLEGVRNMPATVNGIYHNLRESKYTISNGEVVFFFSSKLYRDKFLKQYENHRVIYKNKMNVPLNMDTLSDVLLYESIEKRGFFVRLERARITYDDLYKYALRKMNEDESPKWVTN